MFTGIVEEVGRLRAVDDLADRSGRRLVVAAAKVLDGLEIGASIALNGCCLTVVERGDGWYAADAVSETLDRTTLGALRAGDAVNLERPLRAADRLGGHIVQGHVDGRGSVRSVDDLDDGSRRLWFDAPTTILRYMVEKGSVTVDGVSLTVAALDGEGFAVALVPHTLEATTLATKGVGDEVNLEVDVLAKYVERLLGRE